MLTRPAALPYLLARSYCDNLQARYEAVLQKLVLLHPSHSKSEAQQLLVSDLMCDGIILKCNGAVHMVSSHVQCFGVSANFLRYLLLGSTRPVLP